MLLVMVFNCKYLSKPTGDELIKTASFSIIAVTCNIHNTVFLQHYFKAEFQY